MSSFLIFFVSVLLSILLFYFEEERYNFKFLVETNELFIFLFSVVLIFALPIGIYFLTEESNKISKYSIYLAFLGFIPSIFLLFVVIF